MAKRLPPERETAGAGVLGDLRGSGLQGGTGARGREEGQENREEMRITKEKNLGWRWMNWVKIEVGREETLELNSADASVIPLGAAKKKQ